MTAKEITLNIAVNLGRLARWAMEGKTIRLEQFLIETEDYMKLLEKAHKSAKFEATFTQFKITFYNLRDQKNQDEYWAETMLTWANILTHRAQLA